MNVSDLLLKVLTVHGVKHIFGIPGDAINDVTDAIRRQDKITFIQVRHEEAGAFAASATAKLTGNLAVCLGTAGPGGIHLLNGLYDAKLDHAPVLAITGQIETGSIGTSQFQEVDLEKLFSDVAVYSQTITTEAQLPQVFLEASHAAIAHRGVAHVSIPTNIAGKRVSVSDGEIAESSLPGLVAPSSEDCKDAIELINASNKPSILAGIGCSEAREELLGFSEKIGAPIVRTLRAKEIVDDDNPLCIGGLGLLGGSPAVKAMDQCDLLIMVGTDFPYREFYPEKAKVIQIDIDPTHIGKRRAVDVGLVGHAQPILSTLFDRVDKKPQRDFLSESQNHMKSWLKYQESAETSDDRPIRPARLMRDISRLAPEKSIFVCDTGTVNAWTARHLRIRPGQRFTLSGGLASMGYAMPGAIGAQLAFPDAQIFALAGDGGFAMLMADFLTAVRYDMHIIVIVLNNGKLAFITLEQQAKGLPDHDTDLTNPDFAAFAEACGGRGFNVEDPSQFETVLFKALNCNKPAIIDVSVNPDELVLPPAISVSDALNFGLAKVREGLGGN